jgi:hypothetical protein
MHHALANSSFEMQFLAMIQANVLIGSGSLVQQAASMLSGSSILFDHVPKHGYGVGIEATSDSVDMKEGGEVLGSLRRVRLRLFERMARCAPCSPCRERTG